MTRAQRCHQLAAEWWLPRLHRPNVYKYRSKGIWEPAGWRDNLQTLKFSLKCVEHLRHARVNRWHKHSGGWTVDRKGGWEVVGVGRGVTAPFGLARVWTNMDGSVSVQKNLPDRWSAILAQSRHCWRKRSALSSGQWGEIAFSPSRIALLSLGYSGAKCEDRLWEDWWRPLVSDWLTSIHDQTCLYIPSSHCSRD